MIQALPSTTLPESLLDFLKNPASYPHRPLVVHMTQTHASCVFIAPPFVFKVKKPVNFGFLDFSTLEKRRHFCEREVALNRRLCDDVYLGVAPISTAGGHFTFGDGDEVAEYAVKMRQLSDDAFLDKLLEKGAVHRADLDRIAARLKSFYQSQHPTEEIEAWGRVDRLKISTDENFQQTERFAGQTISSAALDAIRSYTEAFYAGHAPLFASRMHEKRIRDCHGDLHLEHIHLTPGGLHIFDCIEFNDRFRYVDVANDAAFLAMDLDRKGRPDLASHFAAGMAAALNDSGMGRLMGFYKCYRACVRGKVESLHSLAREAPEAERRLSAENARRYFQLALQYAVAGSPTAIIVVMGRVASGKSTLARGLGEELGWGVFSSDRTRKRLAGVPLDERGSDAARARLYASDLTDRTYDALFAAGENERQAGRGAILDATFARRAHREQLKERCAKKGIAVHFVEAQASDDTIKQRLLDRAAAAHEISDARREDFEKLTGLYEPPAELRNDPLTTVETIAPVTETLAALLKALAQAQASRV